MKIVLSILSALMLSACTSTLIPSDVRGASAVDEQLKKDAYSLLKIVASTQMQCKKIEYAQVAKSSVVGKVATEIWIAKGCGKSAPFNMNFVPSPMGGYSVQISAVK